MFVIFKGRGLLPALFQLLVFLASTTFLAESFGDGLDRVWKDRSGDFNERAQLIGFRGDRVWLRKQAGGDHVILIKDLSPEDQKFAIAVLECERSAEQFEQIAAHNPRMTSSPAAVAEIFDSLDKNSRAGFAAALYAGTLNAYSRDPRRISDAKRELDKAIRSLRGVCKALPEVHDNTLACALNNRAVLFLREGDPKKAGSLFTEAASVGKRVPFAVYHNATLLIEAATRYGKTAAFPESHRKKLAATVAAASPETPDAKIPPRFVYSLSHDPFFSFVNAQPKDASRDKQASLPGNRPPNAPSQIALGSVQLGNGSGLLISPTLVLTNRHVVEGHRENHQFVIRNESTFRDGEIGTVVKVSGDEDVDLALIEVRPEKVAGKGIPLRPDHPQPGEEFIVLGYPMMWAFGETLNASRGIVSSIVKDGKNIIHDATTNPGNSGGPCLDECGNAIGVHFAGGAGEGEGRNFAVSVPAAISFLDGTDFGGAEVQKQAFKPADLIAKAKDSVVRVEVYGKRNRAIVEGDDALTNTGDDALDQLITLARLGLWPELTCLDCKGSGARSCPKCRNGTVSEHREVVAFVDPVSGRAVRQKRVFQSRCPNCSGRGGFPCTSCMRGTLPLFGSQ